jgi:hypothetical protein
MKKLLDFFNRVVYITSIESEYRMAKDKGVLIGRIPFFHEMPWVGDV